MFHRTLNDGFNPLSSRPARKKSSAWPAWRIVLTAILLIGAGFPGLASAGAPHAQAGSKPASNRMVAAYGKIPLSFEANRGQNDAQVKFLSRGDGYQLFLTSNSAVFELRTPAGAKSAPVVFIFGAATGSVTIRASTGESCTTNVIFSFGFCLINFNIPGSRTLTGTYSGDSNNNPSVSGPIQITTGSGGGG